MKIESFSLHITNFIYVEWVTRLAESQWASNLYAAFSSNVNPPSSTHLLSAIQPFFFFFLISILLQNCVVHLSKQLWFMLFSYSSFREENTEKYAIFLLRSEWNLYNKKWTTWFQTNDDIVKFIKVTFLILFSCLILLDMCSSLLDFS